MVKYEIGEFVLCKDEYFDSIMRIDDTQIKKCHGELIPRRRYHGLLATIKEVDGEMSIDGCTTVINVREGSLSRIDPKSKLAELIEPAKNALEERYEDYRQCLSEQAV